MANDALIQTAAAPLWKEPKKGAERVDEALCGNVSCQTAESIYGGFEESTEYGRCPGRLIKYPQKTLFFFIVRNAAEIADCT